MFLFSPNLVAFHFVITVFGYSHFCNILLKLHNVRYCDKSRHFDQNSLEVFFSRGLKNWDNAWSIRQTNKFIYMLKCVSSVHEGEGGQSRLLYTGT